MDLLTAGLGFVGMGLSLGVVGFTLASHSQSETFELFSSEFLAIFCLHISNHSVRD